jgi:hypothetical protein
MKTKIFVAMDSSGDLQHLNCIRFKKVVPVCADDMVMKMQTVRLAFVDGQYAKFYSLCNELLRVGPKCNSSSASPDSFHPAEAVAGRERAAGIPSRVLIVPAPRAAEREGVLGSRSPHSPW